jgi:hypothetical protein
LPQKERAAVLGNKLGDFNLSDKVRVAQQHYPTGTALLAGEDSVSGFDCPAPSHLLAVVDLAQIQDVSLDNSAVGHTVVHNHTPMMHLTVFFSCAASQKHDGTRL